MLLADFAANSCAEFAMNDDFSDFLDPWILEAVAEITAPAATPTKKAPSSKKGEGKPSTPPPRVHINGHIKRNMVLCRAEMRPSLRLYDRQALAVLDQQKVKSPRPRKSNPKVTVSQACKPSQGDLTSGNDENLAPYELARLNRVAKNALLLDSLFGKDRAGARIVNPPKKGSSKE